MRDQTSPYHKSLEDNLNLFQRIKSIDDYKILIRRLLAFYSPLEKKLIPYLKEEEKGLELTIRQKTPLLLGDAQRLGLSTSLDECVDLPTIHNFSTALGCLYVLEGASLGGQIISKHFRKQLGLDAQSGLQFYIGYGHNTGRMWQNFREFVMVCSSPKGHTLNETQVIESAVSTFRHYERWICAENWNL